MPYGLEPVPKSATKERFLHEFTSAASRTLMVVNAFEILAVDAIVHVDESTVGSTLKVFYDESHGGEFEIDASY